jgi:hypothetical protein
LLPVCSIFVLKHLHLIMYVFLLACVGE